MECLVLLSPRPCNDHTRDKLLSLVHIDTGAQLGARAAIPNGHTGLVNAGNGVAVHITAARLGAR